MFTTPKIAQLIGGAGTGKTTELLRLMALNLENYGDPLKIGFVSFTRAARKVAADRASDRFNLHPGKLERAGWFRTLHSVCYRVLKIGKELLADNAESRQWLEESLGQKVGPASGDFSELVFEDQSDADIALKLWSAACARLEPLRKVWDNATRSDDRVPPYAYGEKLIRRYEQAKRLDGRVDFTDLLARVAGYRLTVDGPEPCTPDGDLPELPVWFFDEQQDTSALLDAVCHRLIETAERVYVVGDPFQAIYTFAGADPAHFLAWPVADGKRKVMPKSYRCPAPILALGERILQNCSDYWDRKIEPADHAGTIEDDDLDMALEGVKPNESWLLLARTNFLARKYAAVLNDRNVPWRSTRGNNVWTAPLRNTAIEAMLSLETGQSITDDDWRAVLKYLPSNAGGRVMLVRGTKKRWQDKDGSQPKYPEIVLRDLGFMGGTEALVESIRTGRWRSLIEHAERFTDAAKRWGIEAVRNPSLQIGTIHSAKGDEADNVLLCTATGRRIEAGMQTQDGANAEYRVWYVGVTRARRRLVLANDRNARNKMELA